MFFYTITRFMSCTAPKLSAGEEKKDSGRRVQLIQTPVIREFS